MPLPHPTLLKQFAPFAHLHEAEIEDLLETAVSRRYQTGSAVFEQGAEATHFSVLLHGRLRVTQVTSTGEQVVVRMVNPGDIFGIAQALRRSTYPGTAAAVVESIALNWPMEQWEPLVERYPAFASSAVRMIGQRLLEAQARLVEMSTEAVERRVGHTVLRLAQQSGVREPGGVRIDFPISKQDIAEMSGTTLHTVSRILTAWEHAGIVETGRQKLTLRDPHRLLLIADAHTPGLLG